MQTQSRLLVLASLLSILQLGSAIPSKLFARQGKLPEGSVNPITFDGAECQLGLWQHTRRATNGGTWEGYPFRGIDEDTCIDVANLGDNLSEMVSNLEIRGDCSCDFFTDHMCSGDQMAFTAYERQVQDIWMDMDLAKYDNKVNSWKCRKMMREMRMCDVEVFAGPQYGGYPYDASNGQRFQFTSIKDEMGECMKLGDNTKGKVSSYVISGCKCKFFSNESCDAGGLVLEAGDPAMQKSDPNLKGDQNDKIMSFMCEY
ncbi:hypothetical protein ABW21_db0209728 [Orbilia brochopaga]|nr:hypothetical protein ABW21_db0209728 [Drechslerella brochopaga]